MTRNQAMTARYGAAVRLERARCRVRENQRYGLPITKPQVDAIHDAEADYNAATRAGRWAA